MAAHRTAGASICKADAGGDAVTPKRHDRRRVRHIDIDLLEDDRELADPEMRKHIRESMSDYRAGRVRPLQDLLEELDAEESE